mmetsp:Transcript_8443/g.16145  ORF Transcript_8443/g.16145 Transcript_8443/m.16145 type:complete len:95 (+) Transcript_8443:95-379(+)
MGGSSSKPSSSSMPIRDAAAAVVTQEDEPAPSQQEPDKLRDGPCRELFALLKQCQQDKRIVRHDRALTACVDETDLLIRCIHRNPAYFQQTTKK